MISHHEMSCKKNNLTATFYTWHRIYNIIRILKVMSSCPISVSLNAELYFIICRQSKSYKIV